MPNPKYKAGEPILSEEALKDAGSSCEALHEYYMKNSAEGGLGITASVAKSQFGTDGDVDFTISYSDLYDLITLDAMDASLLRCWTL
ncbi:unnamed protein product [Urochloa humidicola]